MSVPAHIIAYARQTLERFVAIPSVAAEGRGIDAAADFVECCLAEQGFQTARHATKGAPVIFGEVQAPGRATLLFYNHYDVQPADPLELWDSDPFVLTERGGKLYGRGAADDKGEIVARLAALKWLKETHGQLPLSIKFLIEGEEEIGSPNLSNYVATHHALLRADACVWEFGGVDAHERPMTYCGLKGILTVELRCKTAHGDLHSSYGAVVDNAAYRMASALASLRDRDGRVLIDGFYDDVTAPTAADETAIAALPHEDAELAQTFGVAQFLGGVKGTAFQRQLYFAPALNINGLHSGYGGPGSKTVLPAEATAKLDIRLVPDQDPMKVFKQLKDHLIKHGFDELEVQLLEHYEHAARSDITHPLVQQTIAALREVYQTEPVVYPNSAGSGPMYPFVKHLGIPIVGIGCGYPGSQIHAPNEHIRSDLLEKGIASVYQLLERYAHQAAGA
jgi:acetylornithine deacetylase/succinyl-diaminopimelate desuccinylase-like protein